jgi:asparagine synthase (glutamine-hydrolysing)
MPQLIEEAHDLWRQAIHRRLTGAKRPGQTLSGGLDSRAILPEASRQTPCWTAITYGLAGCDDACFAQHAAEAMGVTWVFHPLYSGRDPDWLDRCTSYIQQTDGLIQLVDLMHLETLPLQAELLDVHLSGYIGDAVSGPTFNTVTSSEDVVIKMPYYGTQLGMDWETALARGRELVASLGKATARFALFEHKLQQSTNRWAAAWRPWLRVRKPFVDYAFFDFCQGLPTVVRGKQAFYRYSGLLLEI